MPYVKMQRAFDMPMIQLDSTTQTAPGYWLSQNVFNFEDIPAWDTLNDMYRFFRLKSVIIEYTPMCRTDNYVNMFPNPTGAGYNLFLSKGGALETKSVPYYGTLSHPANWDAALNRSGTIRKCPTTRPFRKFSRLFVQNELDDDGAGGADAYKMMRAPWLPMTAANQKLNHYGSTSLWHTVNHISYDSALPVYIQRRMVMTVEFKGFLF